MKFRNVSVKFIEILEPLINLLTCSLMDFVDLFFRFSGGINFIVLLIFKERNHIHLINLAYKK